MSVVGAVVGVGGGQVGGEGAAAVVGTRAIWIDVGQGVGHGWGLVLDQETNDGVGVSSQQVGARGLGSG